MARACGVERLHETPLPQDQFAAVIGEDKEVLSIFSWRHPEQSPGFVTVCKELAACVGSVEIVMEPSGTYGDALRHALLDAGLSVFRVNPKKTNDAKEVYDGVPSIHDAKSAAVIGWLHLEGKSEPWPKDRVDRVDGGRLGQRLTARLGRGGGRLFRPLRPPPRRNRDGARSSASPSFQRSHVTARRTWS